VHWWPVPGLTAPSVRLLSLRAILIFCGFIDGLGVWHCLFADLAEIIEKRLRKGSPKEATSTEHFEYYVHYVDCKCFRRTGTACRKPFVLRSSSRCHGCCCSHARLPHCSCRQSPLGRVGVTRSHQCLTKWANSPRCDGGRWRWHRHARLLWRGTRLARVACWLLSLAHGACGCLSIL
jgi:hypothetical protein